MQSVPTVECSSELYASLWYHSIEIWDLIGTSICIGTLSSSDFSSNLSLSCDFLNVHIRC